MTLSDRKIGAQDLTLNLGNAVQHVADTLDRAPRGALSGLSVAELVKGYRHQPPQDFSRLRRFVDGLAEMSDAELVEWMARRVLAELDQDNPGALEVIDGDRYRLRDGIRLADLRWHGKGISPVNTGDDHLRLGDPFNQKKVRPSKARDTGPGMWVDDIRSGGAISKDDLTELRQSMEVNGWIDDPVFDAVEDEHGVVLIGHRRLRVAAELGIDPRQGSRPEGHIRRVDCGRGDVGDIKRLQYAVVSNIGRRDLSKGDRQAIVKVLAGPEHDWTQMSIAEALGVSQMQISRDVADLKASGGLNSTFKPKRPKGGRPPTPPERKQKPRHGPNQHPLLTEDQKAEFIRLIEDEGMALTKAEAQVRGWDRVRASLTTEAAALRGRRQLELEEQANVTPVTVPATAPDPAGRRLYPVPDPDPAELTEVVTPGPHCPTCTCSTTPH